MFKFQLQGYWRNIDKKILLSFLLLFFLGLFFSFSSTSLLAGERLNKDYYFITLNADYKEDITYNNHTFKFKYTGINTGIHELVEELVKINNEINYPSICVLDKNNIIFNHCGYLKSKEILSIL